MPMKRFALLRLWSLRSGRRCVGIVGLLFTLLLISCADGIAQSDQVVARGLKTFFEAWLKRELRGDELRKVTDEFIAFYAKRGTDRAGIHEAAKVFQGFAKILREHDGAPMAIRLRHNLIEANYFEPDMQNTTELRLLTEPDPVRVVDQDGKHLMTEQDVIALANLCSFITNSDEEPRSQKVSRKKIDAITIELDRAFREDAGYMDRYFRETAALWAGIRREWPNLSAEQKRKVRAYVTHGQMAPMDEVKLYGRLLDLDDAEAFKHAAADINGASMTITVELQRTRELLHTLRLLGRSSTSDRGR
jgi:hypothetical protein